MQGDKLASGAESAVFTGPRLKFDEAQMEIDFGQLSAEAFQAKYYITQREYDLMRQSNGEQANTLALQIEQHLEAINRLTQQDKKEDEALKRECFVHPFAAHGISGRVLVSRDQPVAKETTSKLALPRHLRKEKTLLPTTGHVLDGDLLTHDGRDAYTLLIGKRVLFGQMSGTTVCFTGYPTWIILDVGEILAILDREDTEPVETELEPLT